MRPAPSIETKDRASLDSYLKRKLHILARELGMTPFEYRDFLSTYGVESSTEMTDRQLKDAVVALHNATLRRDVKKSDDYDTWRKRVIAAIAEWLRADGTEGTLVMIKAIAERAGKVGHGDFNKISRTKLIRIYNEFKCKAAWAVECRDK